MKNFGDIELGANSELKSIVIGHVDTFPPDAIKGEMIYYVGDEKGEGLYVLGCCGWTRLTYEESDFEF